MLNIAGALPFSLAPAVAPAILDLGGGSYRVLFTVAGASAHRRSRGHPSRQGGPLTAYAGQMPLLGTKLRAPLPRRRLVARERLVDRLRTGTTRPRLVLVSAPAGFGKTTLLAQWLASDRVEGQGREVTTPAPRVSWLSLDPADADLPTFLSHFVASLQVASPGLGAEALALVDAGRGPSVEDVVASLVNDLDALAGATILALDDYHVIDDPDVHRAVALLLDHLPPQVTLAVTTRADPPLPLSRLRARGELVELRAADLRFTGPEADAFLNDVMGLRLEPDPGRGPGGPHRGLGGRPAARRPLGPGPAYRRPG